MSLLTQKMKEQISSSYPLYSQDGKGKDAICIVKFFFGCWTWYILEGNKENRDFMMFGIVINGMDNEYGYVSLSELEDINVHGFKIELVLKFKEKPLKDIDDDQLQAFLSSIYPDEN